MYSLFPKLTLIEDQADPCHDQKEFFTAEGSETIGRESRAYRIVAIKGTSDFFSIIDDLRMYSETVLFQILKYAFFWYDVTVGLVISDETFSKILNETIATTDTTSMPRTAKLIKECVNSSLKRGIDVTLTGHSLGGGLALHVANKCAPASFLLFVPVTSPNRFPGVRSFTFNAPGSKYSSRSKSFHMPLKKANKPLGFAVEAHGDVVSLVDDHDSPVHTVSCFSNNPLSCHMIHHTACRLLKDCHRAEYNKLGGAAACFDTGIPPDWKWERFKVYWEETTNSLVSLAKNNANTFAANILRAQYRNGRISFSFCILCILFAMLSFARRLKEFYQQTLGRACFVFVCCLFYSPFWLYDDFWCQVFRLYDEFWCQVFSCDALVANQPPTILPHWFYIANSVFARLFWSFVALPIALLGVIPDKCDKCIALRSFLERYRNALDVQHWMLAPNLDSPACGHGDGDGDGDGDGRQQQLIKHEQRVFFHHWIVLLVLVACCFTTTDDREGNFLLHNFALHDFFAFLMMAVAATNASFGALSLSQDRTARSSSPPPKQGHIATRVCNNKAVHSIFIICALLSLLSLFLPSTVVLLLVLACASDISGLHIRFVVPYGINSKDTAPKLNGWRWRVDLTGELVTPVNWSHMDRHFIPHRFFWMPALLYVAANDFNSNSLYDVMFISYKHFLSFITMSFLCEFFARACSGCEKVYFFQRIWINLFVWLFFSMVAEFALGAIGGEPPSTYICMILQTTLLYSLCNISFEQPNVNTIMLEIQHWVHNVLVSFLLPLMCFCTALYHLYHYLSQLDHPSLAFASYLLFVFIFILTKKKDAILTQPVASVLAVAYLGAILYSLHSIHARVLELPNTLRFLIKVAAALSLFLMCCSSRLVTSSVLGYVLAALSSFFGYCLFDSISTA